jgi:hypothetical protein
MVSNGGFQTYLGDRTSDDDDHVDENVRNAIEALRAFGAVEAAAICAETLVKWEAFVKHTADQLRGGVAVDDSEIDAFCDRQDRRLFDQEERMCHTIDEYIRTHEVEFITAGSQRGDRQSH